MVKDMKNRNGLSMAELLVAVALLVIIGLAGFMLFASGQAAWSLSETRMQLQQDLRQIMQKISSELQESGDDSNGVLQVTILDNTGTNGSDILRFAIPICACGTSVIDTDGDVRNWGAPMTWGQAGCGSDYPVDENGKVAICHVPPGNPENPQTLSVDPNAVEAHLAHNDWIGDCNACSPVNYNNRTIEYLLGNNGQFLRRVLDGGNSAINSAVLARNITGFQVSLNGGQTVVSLTVQLSKTAVPQRLVALSGSWDVFLRNK